MLDHLLLTGTAFAQSQPGKQPSTMEALIIPMMFMLVIVYLLIIRPQQKKAKEHQDLMSGLKTGDEIVTSGGIIGRVRSVAENFVTIDAGNSSLKVLKSHVSGLTKPKDVNKPKEPQKGKDSKAK